jgi:hypothetical protein
MDLQYAKGLDLILYGIVVINSMWNVVSGNRLIDRRRKQEAQRRHLRALHKVKPSIDNHTPH